MPLVWSSRAACFPDIIRLCLGLTHWKLVLQIEIEKYDALKAIKSLNNFYNPYILFYNTESSTYLTGILMIWGSLSICAPPSETPELYILFGSLNISPFPLSVDCHCLLFRIYIYIFELSLLYIKRQNKGT